MSLEIENLLHPSVPALNRNAQNQTPEIHVDVESVEEGLTPVPQHTITNRASLYVGDLNIEVTEDLLWNVFTPYGILLSVKVYKNTSTYPHSCYANVNFRSRYDAQKALDGVNFTTIYGTPCRVMWNMSETYKLKNNIGNIFIKNLHPELDTRSLYETYSSFGKILSCKISLDEYGLSKGYGFIQFEDEKNAENACDRTNGLVFQNKTIVVKKFVPKSERVLTNTLDPNQFTNIYVNNFPKDWNESQMRSLFEGFGEITSLIIKKDDKGSSLCFGFINFAKPEFAEAAVQQMKDFKLENGNILNVCRAMKLRERKAFLNRQYKQKNLESNKKWQSLTLYVKNFDSCIDDDKLKEMFQTFGEIQRAYVVKDESNKSRCFGFVTFTTPEQATKAIKEMHCKIFDRRPLYVVQAQNKEDRQKIVQQAISKYLNIGSSNRTTSDIQYANQVPGICQYNYPLQFINFYHKYNQNLNQPLNNTNEQVRPIRSQRNYNSRNYGEGRQGSSNPEAYKKRYQSPQYSQAELYRQPLYSQQDADISIQHTSMNQSEQTIQTRNLPRELKIKISSVCQNMFIKNNYDIDYLTRVTEKTINYFENEIKGFRLPAQPKIEGVAKNFYISLLS